MEDFLLDTETLFQVFGFIEPQIATVSEDGNTGTYTISPLHEGFGSTVGNALRRALLSSLPGAAITELKLDGASHEYETVEGIREDVLDITLNLKQVRLKLHEGEKATITLDVKGEKLVTAGDFTCPSQVEVMNPDLEIFHVSGTKKPIHLECTVERGIKFLVHTSLDAKQKNLGVIPIDAIFSPVVAVTHQVQPTRVGKATNYDELTVTIETDGSISPKDALLSAAKLCTAYFQLIAQEQNFDIRAIKTTTPAAASKSETNKGKTITIDDLDIATRSKNSLAKHNVTSMDALLALSANDLLSFKNFGKKALDELNDALEKVGLPRKEEDTVGDNAEEALVNPEEVDTI